jgi:DNA-directed RNA polymerase subunit RPC12/RpoP
MSEFKFLCSDCGQHILADTQSAGEPFQCPHCQSNQRVPGMPFKAPLPIEGNSAQQNRNFLGAPWMKWKNVLLLVVLGALSPWLLLIGAGTTILLGPLALIAIPVVVGYGSFFFASFCLERTPRKLFWIYCLTSLMSIALPFASELYSKPGHGSNAEPTLGGAIAATNGGLAMILMIPLGLLPWVMGLLAALRKSKSNHSLFG